MNCRQFGWSIALAAAQIELYMALWQGFFHKIAKNCEKLAKWSVVVNGTELILVVVPLHFEPRQLYFLFRALDEHFSQINSQNRIFVTYFFFFKSRTIFEEEIGFLIIFKEIAYHFVNVKGRTQYIQGHGWHLTLYCNTICDSNSIARWTSLYAYGNKIQNYNIANIVLFVVVFSV